MAMGCTGGICIWGYRYKDGERNTSFEEYLLEKRAGYTEDVSEVELPKLRITEAWQPCALDCGIIKLQTSHGRKKLPAGPAKKPGISASISCMATEAPDEGKMRALIRTVMAWT